MDIFKSNIAAGIGIAVVASVAAPVLMPVIATAARPLVKSLIKSGWMLYERSREAVANAGEAMEDLIAEVRAEELSRYASAAAAANSTATGTPAQPAAASRPQGSNGSEQNPGRHEAARGVGANPENGIAM